MLNLPPPPRHVSTALGICHIAKVGWGYTTDPQFDRTEAIRFMRSALSIHDDDPDTLAWGRLISSFIVVGDREYPFGSSHFKVRAYYWDPIRTEHYGQRLHPPHNCANAATGALVAAADRRNEVKITGGTIRSLSRDARDPARVTRVMIRRVRLMSALPPKADIVPRNRDVRFTPKRGHWLA